MVIEVVKSQVMQQEYSRTAFTGKVVATIAEDVVGKYAVLCRIDGVTVCGIGETENIAIENAKNKIAL